MVNIDTVYQTVLALANKEQRGYITPQEFNLFAEQSQLEIIEQYFYDINQFDRVPDNSLEYSNMVDLINQKLAGLKVLDFNVNMSATPSTYVVPNVVYKLGSVYLGMGGFDKFELHTSEVSELVYRILMLAGITINKQEISSAATALQGGKTQQEKQ